jgi:hypothetical protein
MGISGQDSESSSGMSRKSSGSLFISEPRKKNG